LFDKPQLTRIKPLIFFFITYTAIFYLFAISLNYTFPFVAGFLLALMVQPLIRTLKKHLHLKPGAAAALSTTIVFIVLFGLMFLLGYWLIIEIHHLMIYITYSSKAGFTQLSAPINSLLNQFSTYLSKIDAKFIQQNKDQIINILQSGSTVATGVLGTTLKFLTSLPAIFTMFIVMIFSTYFFSKDMSEMKEQAKSLFSQSSIVNIRSASHHGVNMSGKYLCSYLLIYFITFVETLIVFTALGVPYPLVISIVTGVADVMPVLGPGTIYIPLALFYLVSGNFFKAGALIVCWLLITSIRQIIEPKIVSSSINVHPLTMLAAIYFALIAENFWILIYFSVLIILYQILTQLDIMPPLFLKKEDQAGAEDEKKP